MRTHHQNPTRRADARWAVRLCSLSPGWLGRSFISLAALPSRRRCSCPLSSVALLSWSHTSSLSSHCVLAIQRLRCAGVELCASCGSVLPSSFYLPYWLGSLIWFEVEYDRAA